MMKIIRGKFGPATLSDIFAVARSQNWQVEKRGHLTSWTYWFTYMGKDLQDEQGRPIFQFMVVDEGGKTSVMLERIHMTCLAYNPKRNRDFQAPIFYKHLSELDEALDVYR